jgi:hypothetical protein
VRYTGIFLKKLAKQQCEMILCVVVSLSTVNPSINIERIHRV